MPRPQRKDAELTLRFSPEQVQMLSERLQSARRHARATLHLRTVADQVSSMDIDVEEAEEPQSPEHRPIEDVLEELGAQVPQEEWNRLPLDLSDQFDHYLYGLPKRKV